MILTKVSKWEVKTSKIGGFNSLHTPALTQVPLQKKTGGNNTQNNHERWTK